MTEKYLVFDGACGLCHAWVRFILRHDIKGKLRFVPAGSPMGQQLLQEHDLSVDDLETMLYLDGDLAWKKSDAFIQIVKILPFPVSLLKVIVIIPRFIRNAVYDGIASNRYHLFGQREVCTLLDGDYRDRFIQ